MIDFFLAILLGFVLTGILAPFVISMLKKMKAKQNILSYVDNHKAKQGTPTMGGIFFVLAIIISSLTLFRGSFRYGIMGLASLFGFGVIGFLDDFIKIKFDRNLGLRAYQKIIGQTGIAVIIAIFCYYNGLTKLYIPFSDMEWDIGHFIIPLAVLIMLASTNSVNLTDGLDGLAGGVMLVYMLFFGALLLINEGRMSASGVSLLETEEQRNNIILTGAVLGAMLSWMIFNSHKASIFMGDAGSLALGGVMSTLALTTKTALFLPLFGIMFVLSSISVIIQVVYFKLTKKRVFLMAPFHHHLERKGLNESKIVALYMIITFLAGTAVLLGAVTI